MVVLPVITLPQWYEKGTFFGLEAELQGKLFFRPEQSFSYALEGCVFFLLPRKPRFSFKEVGFLPGIVFFVRFFAVWSSP